MRSKRTLWISAITLVLAACGGGDTTVATSTTSAGSASSTSEQSTTSTRPAPTTTTTLATTTTTTTIGAPAAADVVAQFRSYFDLIAAGDYEGAAAMSSGSANDYANFVSDLASISPQPNWALEAESQPLDGDAEILEDGRAATPASLTYADGGNRLAVGNPAVLLSADGSTLDEWGIDLGTRVSGPTLGQRLKSIALSPNPDPTSCFPDGLWAYIPGGSDTSVDVSIITIGRMCDLNDDLIVQGEASRLYTEDGAVDITASVVFIEGGGDTVQKGSPTRFLATFTVPFEDVSKELIWDTPFDRVGKPATTFANFAVGPFDLD